MALPALGKPVSISKPKRGRHGIFADLAEDSLDDFKPSVVSASTWSQDSWISGFSQPRSLAPFDPEESAAMELAPRGWARKTRPIDHRSNDVKRLRGDEEVLCEAKRSLRAVKPGDWNAGAFAFYKKKLTDEARWLALPGLVDMVRRSSDEALRAGSYCLPSKKHVQVRLSQKPSVRWTSLEGCTEAEPCQGVVPPPLVVSHKTPLEAAGCLAKNFKGHPVIVTFEATEFDRGLEGRKKGQMIEGEARGLAQQELFLCSNFVFSSRAASRLCTQAGQTPEDRLCSLHDPGVIVADDVAVFRGSAEDGYPFLEEQFSIRVLVAGRSQKRPWLQRGEQFLNQDDFLAFSHRLNLMTYQALELQDPKGPAPVLVLGAAGLANAEYRQPRGGIAQALKTWRTMWAGYFEAVVVACGDKETAGIIDRAVNTDIYMKVLQNLPVTPGSSQWHWQLELVQLSYNPVFANIAARMASQREAPASRSASLRPEEHKKRRSSGAGIMFLTEAMSDTQRPAGATLQHAPSKLSLMDGLDGKSEAGELSHSVSRLLVGRSSTSAAGGLEEAAVASRLSLMTRENSMISTVTTGGGRHGAGRRASLAVGKDGQAEDSRALMERHAKLRMEQTDHEQQLKDEEDRRNQAKMAEILAKAWGVAGKTMSGIVSKVEKGDKRDSKKDLHGRLGGAQAEKDAQEEKKAQLETMTLDKKRQIDSAAAVLGCPVDLRNYIFKQIEKEIKLKNNMAKEKDEEEAEETETTTEAASALKEVSQAPATEEVTAAFEDVRLLAESIEKLLEPRWKDLHGGSYSARTPRKSPGMLPAIKKP